MLIKFCNWSFKNANRLSCKVRTENGNKVSSVEKLVEYYSYKINQAINYKNQIKLPKDSLYMIKILMTFLLSFLLCV